MKLLLVDIEKTIQSKLDLILEDLQKNGISCSSAPEQSIFNGFVLGLKSAPIDLDNTRIEVPSIFLKYFDKE